MTDEPVVGIDLGTTNSVVAFVNPAGAAEAIADEDGQRTIPSVVHFPEGGDPVVGSLAKQQAVVDPHRVAAAFKRGMGRRTFLDDDREFVVDGTTYPPEALSAMVLKKLKQAAEAHFRGEVRKAIITVPAYFGDAERKATVTAGEMAGLDVLRVINEPTAAALAHGLGGDAEAGTILVFDLGGGTFDVTVMAVGADGSLEVKSTGGDHRFGGLDFDRLIVDRMAAVVQAETGADLRADPYAHQDALAKAEEMKKELSRKETSTRPLTAGGRSVMFTLTRAEFDGLLAESGHLQEAEDHIINTIEDAGMEPGGITSVLMVGGSSRIIAFKDLVERVIGREPQFSKNLDEDVARGAAFMAAKLEETVDPDGPGAALAQLPTPVDVASRGLGVQALDSQGGGQLVNVVLIDANTPVPAHAEQTFGASRADQTDLELVLTEGEETDLDFVTELGRTKGTFSKPVPLGHPVTVRLEYSVDQRITAKAIDGHSGDLLCELEVKSETAISDDEKAALLSTLANTTIG
ncbi:MAG: Hsp70 family protein [Acidimicrobiales bacterium]|nr:Hsp70 family protein [Acidimicrobiales bacterium]